MIGVNGNMLHSQFRWTDVEAAARYMEAGLKHVRFPGGTIGNYYCPDTETFTCAIADQPRAERFETRRQAIGSYGVADLALFCRRVQPEVSIVLNVLCTPAEATERWLIRMREANINVVRVELGNEIHGHRYEWAFERGTQYVFAAAAHAMAARRVFPDVKVGIPISPAQFNYGVTNSARLRDFDDAILAAAGTFYDALILHVYPRYDENDDTPAQAYHTAVAKLEQGWENVEQLYDGHEIWVTEFGLAAYNKLYRDHFLYSVLMMRMINSFRAHGVTVMSLHNFSFLWMPASTEPDQRLITVLRYASDTFSAAPSR